MAGDYRSHLAPEEDNPPNNFRTWVRRQMMTRPPDLRVEWPGGTTEIRYWTLGSFTAIEIVTPRDRDEEVLPLVDVALTRCRNRQSPLRGLPVLFFSSTRSF